jgi:hypothetical protein
MKAICLLVAFAASITVVAAQNDKARGDAPDNKTKSAKAGGAISAATTVEAELQKQLDVRNARVGDAVLLRTTKAVKHNGETVIAKGASVVGRITDVKENAKNRGGSAITMVFDRIQNGGETVPVSATIVSRMNIAASTAVDDTFASDISGNSRTSGSAASSGGSGLLGGLGNTVSGVVGGATQTVGSTVNTATQAAAGTTASVGRTVGGLQISGSASGSASGSSTISTSGKNLRLEKGAKFNLAVTAQGQN